MTRRRSLVIATIAVALLVLGALESQHIISGWLRGEAFYRGRPTSFWRAELRHWSMVERTLLRKDDEDPDPVAYVRDPYFWERLPYACRLFPNSLTQEWPFENGGEDARAVLTELSVNGDSDVRDIAAAWLRRLPARKEKD